MCGSHAVHTQILWVIGLLNGAGEVDFDDEDAIDWIPKLNADFFLDEKCPKF